MVDKNKALAKYLATPCPRVPFKTIAPWMAQLDDADEYRQRGRVPRGSNLDFIAVYLFVHGPSRASDVIKAMCKRVGVEYTRGQYNEYFYRVNGCARRYGELFKGGERTPYFGRNPVHCKSPLWTQLWKRGPWAITPGGAKRVADLLKRCASQV